VQASKDLKLHTSQLRAWVKKFCDDPDHTFPGNGQEAFVCRKAHIAGEGAARLRR
jgi:hypothetical protein